MSISCPCPLAFFSWAHDSLLPILFPCNPLAQFLPSVDVDATSTSLSISPLQWKPVFRLCPSPSSSHFLIQLHLDPGICFIKSLTLDNFQWYSSLFPFHEGLLNHINCLQRHTFSVLTDCLWKFYFAKKPISATQSLDFFSDCLTMFPFCCPSSSSREGYYFWNFSSLFKSLFDFFFSLLPLLVVGLHPKSLSGKTWLTIRIQCYECNIPECFVCRED